MSEEFLPLEIRQHRAVCPFCQKAFTVGRTPEKTDFWGHYFSKKHADVRPKSAAHTDFIKSEIVRVNKQIKSEQKTASIAERNQELARRKYENIRQAKSFKVGGLFLDCVIGEIESLIGMMEPYYSQCDADKDGRAMVSKIESIMRDQMEEIQGDRI